MTLSGPLLCRKRPADGVSMLAQAFWIRLVCPEPGRGLQSVQCAARGSLTDMTQCCWDLSTDTGVAKMSTLIPQPLMQQPRYSDRCAGL